MSGSDRAISDKLVYSGGDGMEEFDTGATIGGLSARMTQVEKRLDTMDDGLNSILAILNQARGGWRVVLGVCAVIGGMFGFIELLLKR